MRVTPRGWDRTSVASGRAGCRCLKMHVHSFGSSGASSGGRSEGAFFAIQRQNTKRFKLFSRTFARARRSALIFNLSAPSATAPRT
ncbi:hypothetical protein BQ8482_360044 [Mesorhizobium delmotii]|uniref:Uncharacterized protein n=1 Tax=Mesorhizobium delmotii TaxID=1631247 RepID=A0A2P9ARA5_9HYPH|nr:hypothetical protein BQ8482_360044 [Mesorhizobium delmotii]